MGRGTAKVNGLVREDMRGVGWKGRRGGGGSEGGGEKGMVKENGRGL